MTLTELINHHNGTVGPVHSSQRYEAQRYEAIDVVFPTAADGQHFRYATGQRCWQPIVLSVQHIADHNASGAVLYYVAATDANGNASA